MEREIKIPVPQGVIDGSLAFPENATGLVVFVHGSGSSRFSPRNRFVASCFNYGGLATLLIDLLTQEEETLDMQTAEFRFNIPLLAQRVAEALDWTRGVPDAMDLKIGLFGASTGAAAALMTAAERPHQVHAVVSRGGRPDLAMADLPRVKAPTLLIVGGYDYTVIEYNRMACEQINAEKKLVIIPGATHLFEESGTLEEVARVSAQWFEQYLK